MGMKSAACWCAHEWQVRTKPLGDPHEYPHEYTVNFNIEEIVAGDIEELSVETAPALADEHYTEIRLRRLHKAPTGRTLGKIREHLADIYRTFTRSGQLELFFNDEPLTYKEPAILRAPYYEEPAETPRIWAGGTFNSISEVLSVHGFAALRERASTSRGLRFVQARSFDSKIGGRGLSA